MADKTVSIDPPGSVIKAELDARGWSQRDLAFILDQTEQQVNPLLAGKRAITPDMARLLGDAFDVAPEFFSTLQSQYDLANAKEPDPAVRVRAELQAKYPVREMLRRGWIVEGDASLLRLQIARFFEIDQKSAVAFAAKKTSYSDVNPSQLAWLFRVRQLARSMDAPKYSSNKLRAILPKLRSLMVDPEAIVDVPKILLECGVRLIVVESLPSAKIDGVCTWLDADSPVIGLTTLHDRLDNFWFVLRHEIEHVLRGDAKETYGILDTLTGEMSAAGSTEVAENAANSAAADFCVPAEKMKSFYERKFPYFSERDVVGFSSLNSVHPALVVGQLQRRMNRYDYLRKYQVPVRKHLIGSAVTDGWGSVAVASL